MAPFNGTAPEMQLGRHFREHGLYTFVRWNTLFTNPPLCITKDKLREVCDYRSGFIDNSIFANLGIAELQA